MVEATSGGTGFSWLTWPNNVGVWFRGWFWLWEGNDAIVHDDVEVGRQFVGRMTTVVD